MPADRRLGVLAFGDSITNGGGELQWGVALQSWALWVARALGVPYSPYAEDGATARDVVARQLPAFAARSGGEYDVGCLYAGVNDVRRPDFDPAAFGRDHREALAFLAARCERVLTVLPPERLGWPATPADRIAALRAGIAASAREHGALVLDLRAFGARNRVMADRVHPTALGQVAIAERALAVLAADGLPAKVRPSSLIAYETTRAGRLRGDAAYAWRALKAEARRARPALRAAAARASRDPGRSP